ncbi:RluA family pseudouridine synthase [Neptunicoccus cionae]|uniref:RluA family pseudouridine synthase n=1 Tax=Neptunicoccus cionae TaxID=2035344 RepID=UPI000C7843F1|nr:RluA family pseudouridine synthase [Amylibacter cionae]PLS19934.1 RluA family pseudouridine synthase [Amylibacter cionae]
MSGVQHIAVAEDAADQRLDRWLRRMFPHVSQGRVEKMCRKGDLRVDKGRVKANTRLQPGQVVRIPPLPDPGTVAAKPEAVISDADAKLMQDSVIYRDDDIIVLNKPAGLAVQGGSGQTRHIDGLADALRFEMDTKPKLVHRLDKDTSGVFVMARTGRAAAGLAKSFHLRTTRKIYWAMVAGSPFPKMGTIRYGLVKAAGHGPNGAGERMHCIHPDEVEQTEGAKRATTDYAVIEAVGQRAAWVGLVPITGRTHQLRAHMAEIGHPIIGDGKYGTNSQVNEGDGWGAQLGGSVSRKLHLHARSLAIPHPVSGAKMTFTAPLPDHMAQTWDFFGFDPAEAPTDPFEEQE